MDEFMSVLTKSNDIDETKKQNIKEHLRGVVPPDVYEKWIDYFVVEAIDDDQIVIGYYGKASLRKFEKKYKKMVWLEICSYLCCVKKLNIYKRKQAPVYEPATLKNVENKSTTVDEVLVPGNIKNIIKNPFPIIKLVIIVAVIAGILTTATIFGSNYITNQSFYENFYNVGSIKANEKIRIIQITDLHNSKYGEENNTLYDRVKKLDPDIIIYTGDCIEADETSVKQTINLCSRLAEVAPSYYIYGNNEIEYVYGYPLTQEILDEKFGFGEGSRKPEELLKLKDDFEKQLEKNGVNVLKNETNCIEIGSTMVDIYGSLTSNPSSFYSYSGEAFNDFIYSDETHLKVFAIHEPFVFEEFEPDSWGDIMLCGHTHGGMVRIPFLGPLYTREGGLFPERNNCYVSGRYNILGRPLIVSPGLENENIFRINNEPELTIVDINRF